MKKRLYRHGAVVLVALALMLTGIPALAVGTHVYAQETETTADGPTTSNTKTTERPNANAKAAEKRAAVQTKLADKKLKACQNRERVITSIMARLADRGQKQLDLFTSIADKTKQFYTDKGQTLSNYDALVAEVDAKKAAAQTTVDTIKSTSVEFKCDGTDPKGVASSFKEHLKAEIAALKAYKTAVKNLIVGVKSVQPTTDSSTEGDQ